MPFVLRIMVLSRFMRIDWNIVHAHRPCEIVQVCRAISDRKAIPREIVVEAGCWNGGSSAKLSIICGIFGYRLWIFDSFQGVEAIYEDGYDFSGEYVAQVEKVKDNLGRYGCLDVCCLIKGWFRDTLAVSPIQEPVRVVFIDCDLAKGTREVLQGVLPQLVADGTIFTQDYHITSVRKYLEKPNTWSELGKPIPILLEHCGNLASLHFPLDS